MNIRKRAAHIVSDLIVNTLKTFYTVSATEKKIKCYFFAKYNTCASVTTYIVYRIMHIDAIW